MTEPHIKPLSARGEESPPKVLSRIDLSNKNAKLIIVSVVAMGGLGVAASLVALVREFGFADFLSVSAYLLLLLPYSFSAGGAVGLLSIPAVLFGLARTNLRIALPIVYGVSLMVVVVFARTSDSETFAFNCAVAGLVSVCAISVLGRFVFSPQAVVPVAPCSNCNYDLRGNTTGVCPECVAPVSNTTP